MDSRAIQAYKSTSPKLYVPLENTYGATDQSGNGYAIATAGTPTPGGYASSPYSFESYSTDLNGSTDGFGTVGYFPSNGHATTFAFWFNLDAYGGCWIGDAYGGLALQDGGSGNFAIYTNVFGAAPLGWSGGYGLGTWNHITLVFDEPNDTATAYLNGVSLGAGAGGVQTAFYQAPGDAMGIGFYPGQYINGRMAHFAVWERALTTDEIAHIYGATLFAPTVTEKPPLFEMIDIETPGGRHFRWSEDEPNADRRPSGVNYADVMPGGDDTFDAELPRKPEIDYADLEPLSTIRVYDAAGDVVSTTRLEQAPRASGDNISITPQAVGWKAALEDNKLAAEVYVDTDMTHWSSAAALYRSQFEASATVFDPNTEPDTELGIPRLFLGWENAGTMKAGYVPYAFAYYDAGSASIASLSTWVYRYINLGSPAAAKWISNQLISNNYYYGGVAGTDFDVSADLTSLNAGVANYLASTVSPTTRRFAYLNFYDPTTGVAYESQKFGVEFSSVAVYGQHGLTLRGTATSSVPQGLYASDVITHAVTKYCPMLDFTTGTYGSIRASAFVHTQLEFRDPTTPAEIIKAANRVHLYDWYVRGKTFYYEPRGTSARRWQARVGPSRLEETGADVQRQWNGVGVRFTDVDGSKLSVGPPNSGATVESARLLNSDPSNPWNMAGIPHWENLDLGGTGSVAVATEVGTRFLEEAQYVDRSGKASLTGHVQDDRGVWHPYSHVQSGDEISFIDAADTSYRRIVKTSKDRKSRTVEVDLDAPPQGMDAVLERLGAKATELGLS